MKSFCALVLAVVLVACDNPDARSGNDQENVDQKIFPVTDFLSSQVRLVDSLQLPVIKFVTSDKKTDSVLISLAEFKTLAKEFLTPDISQPAISRFYKEDNFADQSIPSVTLTYTALRNDLEVTRVDVNINPNPVLDDKVRSIYLEKKSMSSDTFVHKKLYWRTGRNFQIITSRQVTGGAAITHIVKCVWNYTD